MDARESIPFGVDAVLFFLALGVFYLGYTTLAAILTALGLILAFWLFRDMILDLIRHPGAWPNSASPNKYSLPYSRFGLSLSTCSPLRP
jgi:hypothetical protein